ncbi:Wzz/FepE/Etk N-terminal domain-containing protein [Bradyrhizobium sp. CIAT3101]|uniref:Wzz/FepE/Etk N-terminal domain-containing protein n=1 Tax=Bradyrhizobium sp. CIAT3101 TaxID=439387 RepID=UPI0024B0FABA|nr:Wzz/FepE/Etk N-terminal domain-containing protein [Bradyrhizobium sp. CIAT3101]WFU84481.1 Wzz/FepE/Etk N-terminal domain-containing protein [Bradyrhizobium sp. CIAT3101]
MDMPSHRIRIGYSGGRDEASSSISALIDQPSRLARRQYWIIVIVPAATIAIGLLYLLVTPSQYTATATLLIDGSTLRVMQNQLQPQADIPLDTLQAGSLRRERAVG